MNTKEETKGDFTLGSPISCNKDYYRDDYDNIREFLACEDAGFVILGLRRFGKTSLLKRIEGLVNQSGDYKKFLSSGLNNWNRERDGNEPKREFFDEIKSLNGKALYLSFGKAADYLQDQIILFIRDITGNPDCNDICFDKYETLLPSKIFILIDEFLKLTEEDKNAEEKRELFLKLRESADAAQNKRIVFIIAEPTSIFQKFEDFINRNPAIEKVHDAFQGMHIKTLPGLSGQEKHNLFCLKKTENHCSKADPVKITSILEQLSGIPLEIQYAGKTYLNYPEKEVNEILKKVARDFSLDLKSIIQTMTVFQQVFLRLLVESENNNTPLSCNHLTNRGRKILGDLKHFGLVKEVAGYIKLTSEPIRQILCDDTEKNEVISPDDIYQKELENIFIIKEKRMQLLDQQKITSINDIEPWDGKIRIHHFSDLALGELIPGFKHDEDSDLNLKLLNDKKNHFQYYLDHLENKPDERPHILLFTGDIALHRHMYCYRSLRHYLNEITEFISPLPGKSKLQVKDQIILVPGEMDVSNFPVEECNQSEYLKKNDAHYFAHFFDAFKNYGLPNPNASENSLSNMINIEIPTTSRSFDYKLQFLLFNSATMLWEFDKMERCKRLKALGNAVKSKEIGSIKTALDSLISDEIGFINMNQLEKQSAKNDSKDKIFRIAVTHHNLNPHKVRENTKSYTVDTKNAFEAKKVLLQNQFRVILHGHQRSPIFIKETLYEKDIPQLNTLLMNGAGRFTDMDNEIDKDVFEPSFNCYEIQTKMVPKDNNSEILKKYFIIQGYVMTYQDENKEFKRSFSMNEEFLPAVIKS